MILYFADRHLNILGQATSHLPKGVRLIYDLKSQDVESGVSVFEGDISFDRKTRAKVEKWAEVGNYILKNADNESELYSIIDAIVDTKKQKVSVYAEDDGLDLINDIAEAYAADQEYPISSYVERFAGGAGWEIGINEVEGLTRKLSWDSEQTVSARLRSTAEAFNNCELSFSFIIKGLKISKKYINIYEKRGKDTGVQLRLNKEIDSIVTTKSIANLATALKPRGSTPNDIPGQTEAPITLLGYEYDDGDFYVDGAVLKSRKALQKWSRFLWKGDDSQQSGGHIVKSFNYDTTSQAVLCEKTIEELKKVCDMEINYEVDIRRLPDNVKIGDRVNIIDDAGELYLSTRILKLESSESDREYKATLGEHLIKGSGISQKVADLAAQFAANTQSAQKALEVANAAKENADAAKEEAEKAAQDATQAQEKAEEAKQAADSATESANQAAGKADAATEAVDKVEESVSGLQQTIENAQQAAQNAHQAAQDATERAEQAEQAAQNAQAKAEEAATANSEAQAKAEEAINKANTATETANTAKTTAQAASDTAAAARADAQAAKGDIAKWESELETVVDTMESDYTRKTEFTETTASLQSQITRNAGEISSTIKSVETIDETANSAKQLADSASETAAQAKEQANSASATAAAAQQAADTASQAAQAAQSEADTAKAAAEAAQSVADKAEADLRAAEADLATVAGRVDATEEEIAAAQTKVNEAQAAADKAKEDAQVATEKANTAQSTANTAVENAAAAQAKADKAATDAAAAQQKAEEAKGNAAAAQAKANEAAATAAQAQEIANTAKNNADNAQATANQAAADAATAQQKADTAAANAAQAQTDLNTAKQNLADVTSRVGATEEEVAAAQAAVEVAQAAADKAKADAATAQSAADKAKTDAAAAQTAANNAKTAADNAQAAADAAQEAADKAQEDVNALAVRVTTTEAGIKQTKEQLLLYATKDEVTTTLGGYYSREETDAQIDVKADEITSTVSSSYLTKDDYTQDRSELTEKFSEVTQTTESLDIKFTEKTTETDNEMHSKFSEIYKYFSFTENGIIIGGGENALTLSIDNEGGLVFAKNGVPFGWWDGVDFHTGNIVVSVNERAQFGDFAFIPRSSGSLSFLKVRGSNSSNLEHTHSYTSAVTKVATCTTTGTRSYMCSCGESYTEEIPALGHIDSNGDGVCDRCSAPTGSTTTNYTITLVADPTNGGTVTGGGIYAAGDTVMIEATANAGYQFVDWYENGSRLNRPYATSFKASSNRTLTAKFESTSGGGTGETVDIHIKANELADVGIVGSVSVKQNGTNVTNSTGDYTFNVGDTITVTTTANSGYNFFYWANGDTGDELSRNNPYTFTVSSSTPSDIRAIIL
jgi:phage minor structural protein